MFYLGLDAGGSKCAARLTDAQGHVLGEGLAGCANMRTGVVQVVSRLQDAYEQAIMHAGLDKHEHLKIIAGAGIAGIGREGARTLMDAQPFPFVSIRFESDAHIALLGAHSGRDGGIVIIGTGSIGIGRVQGQDIQVGGYGFPVSDEGSGAWIGLQAIRRTLRALDGRIPHSILSEKLLARFARDSRAIIGWMDKASATDYAALAPMVADHAEKNDMIAREIFKSAARHIEMMVSSLLSAGVTRCSLGGGLADRITPWLTEDIRNQIIAPDGDALDGALYLARSTKKT